MKKSFVLFLIICLMAFMAACNKGGNGTEKTPEITQKATEAAPTAAPTPTNTPSPTEDPTKTSEPPEGYDSNVTVPAADIFDALIKDGTVADKSANGLKVDAVNEPTVKNDSSIGKDVIELVSDNKAFFAVYNFGSEYNKLEDGFTFEVNVYLDSPIQYQVIGGNQQAGGFCLAYDMEGADGDGSIAFAVHNGEGYIKAFQENQPAFDRYYHAVGVFDGTKVKLYLNGRLVDESDLDGTIKFPPEVQYLAIGADTGMDANGEYFLDGKISIFRLYNDVLNDSQIYKLYVDSLK